MDERDGRVAGARDHNNVSDMPSDEDVTANLPRSMRLRNRAVAEREASRLARPDGPSKFGVLQHASRSRSAVSSTPFGGGRPIKNTVTGENDSEMVDEWCGPFSVARQMIAAREDARKKREAEQKNREEGTERHPFDILIEEVEVEKKRKANPSITWRGDMKKDASGRSNYYVKRRRRHNQQQSGGKVQSLFLKCVDLIVENFGKNTYLARQSERSPTNFLFLLLT